MRTFILVTLFLLIGTHVDAAQKIGSVARIKGQEPILIQGYGLVTGLRGTGDKASDFKETGRMLQRTLQLTGHPNVTDREVGTVKNVAIVHVQATIPPQGARSGDTLDITVSSAASASSLKDGVLVFTDLMGPVPQTPEMTQTFAKAWGQLVIEKPETPTVAKVINGARLTADFRNPYIHNNCITLVLPERHANWFMANAIVEAINDQFSAETGDEKIAIALDQQNISVKIPFADISNPVQFIARVNGIPLLEVERIPTVAINERTGAIAVDADVEIAPVAISHKSVSLQPQAPQQDQQQQPGEQEPEPPNRWVKIDLEEARGGITNLKLQALLDALNAMKVPPQDTIDIIRTIDRKGDLYGQIIYTP